MKWIILMCLLVMNSFVTMSFFTPGSSGSDLKDTKWISPLTDQCYHSLCFTSERNVMLYDCEKGHSTEVGYVVHGNRIEIQAFSKSNFEPESQLVLYEDNGVLRQLPDQVNSFPRIYIKVQSAMCDQE